MRFIPFSINSGQKNMQIDSDLLDKAIIEKAAEPIFRLYGWSPKCISLGRNQRNFNCENKGIDCVRRLTGGRALLHDDEITYSYISPISIIPNGEKISDSYKYISGILINFFKTLGIELDLEKIKKYQLTLNIACCFLQGLTFATKNKK